MKQKIRDEILETSPVTEMDSKIFSGYLAEQSRKSKSEDEIQADKQRKQAMIKQRTDELKKRRKETETE